MTGNETVVQLDIERRSIKAAYFAGACNILSIFFPGIEFFRHEIILDQLGHDRGRAGRFVSSSAYRDSRPPRPRYHLSIRGVAFHDPDRAVSRVGGLGTFFQIGRGRC